MKEFGSQKSIIEKMAAMGTLTFFRLDSIKKGLCLFYDRADQLLSQLLMEQLDTLYTKCRHIEHMHEGVWFTKNIIDKMTAMRT